MMPDCRTVVIPDFLLRAIGENGGIYQPNYMEAQSNLRASHGKVAQYLGTYFPRTIGESIRVFSEILGFGEIRQGCSSGEYRVLDLGAGTGGASFGCILALHEAGVGVKRVTIDAVDGNSRALTKMVTMGKAVEKETGIEIRINTQRATFPGNPTGFRTRLNTVLEKSDVKYDAILAWKFLNEVYRENQWLSKGIYHELVDGLSGALTKKGVLIVADPTDRTDTGVWIPVLMNREFQEIDTDIDAPLSTIIPIPCAVTREKIRPTTFCNNCYGQRRIPILINTKEVVSKLYYRVLGHRDLVSRLAMKFDADAGYRVNESKAENSCPSFSLSPIILSGYSPGQIGD
jgi:SAM-dependent methyltransferase